MRNLCTVRSGSGAWVRDKDGCQCRSAQRFANMTITVFKTEMDKMELEVLASIRTASPQFDKWCKHRESLGDSPVRLYHVLVYTDDPVWLLLGADRVARALKLWHWLTSGAGLPMAIPKKRPMGTSGTWLGIKFLSHLGFSVVPAQKSLRACMGIDLCLSQTMSFADYRRLIGFLEHVRDILFLRGDKMYGLYAPHIRELEPAHTVVHSSIHHRWPGKPRVRADDRLEGPPPL